MSSAKGFPARGLTAVWLLAMLAILSGGCRATKAGATRPASPRVPVLRLLLDVDGNLDPLNIVDDSTMFLPGRLGADPMGTRPTAEVCGADGQIARVIAVFVDPARPDRAVPPPPETAVTFSLEKTTAYPGCATNTAAADNTGADYALFVPGTPDTDRLTVRFDDRNQAEAHLRIRDYGGLTRVRAVASGGQDMIVPLPLDEDGNQLADLLERYFEKEEVGLSRESKD